MCGICGFVNLDRQPADLAIVQRMTATLAHRGPDDGGIYGDGHVALGHRRLAILDPARGRQPMSWAHGRYHIAHNGEVYNHREVRSELPLPHEAFQTTADTETILAAYQQWGAECLSRLNGMFAWAIYDAQEPTLFLARDRLGIKPLYVYQSARLLAFASEIKALLAHPEIRVEVNVDRLPVQLALKYTLDDQTLFRGIRKLMPGHYLRWSAQGIEEHCYWDLRFRPKQKYQSLAEAAGQFRSHFRRSVERQLLSDVPLGVFLSGGIDSSVIAATMSELSQGPIQAFSVAFPESGYSELSYARHVAQHVGAQMREVIVQPGDWFRAWPHMVYHEDEPIAHPSSIPLHFVSKLAANHVKVVLTGEGSDELLAGYERYYQTLINLRFGRFVPHRLRKLARQVIDLLPDQYGPKRKAVRTSLYLDQSLDALLLDNYAAIPRGALAAALQPNYVNGGVDAIYQGFHDWMEASDAEDLLDQILYADIKTYLLELLMKQDQMSMSASLESRVPFLDHELVEFVSRLPIKFKLSGMQTKRILREGLGDVIPASILHRPKQGFPTPIREWFRGEYFPLVENLLCSPQTLLYEYIQPQFVRDVLFRHRQGKWDLHEQIWTLGNLELWLRIFVDGQSPETAWPVAEEIMACISSG